MAFDMNAVGGYGSGQNGDVVYASGQINSYANVTFLQANTLEIGAPSYGVYEKFTAGTSILLHVSATNGTSTDTTYLGAWQVLKITAVNGSSLTVSPAVTCITGAAFGNYQVQVVTVAEFVSLTLNSGVSLTPPAYDVTKKYGGIVVLKCSDKLTFAGGHIDLTDKGIPRGSANNYRPLTPQENDAGSDSNNHAGWENTNVFYRAKMNIGDGVVFIFAKSMTGNENSRIGSPSQCGGQYYRGNFTGGSTILLAAKTIDSFSPSMIAKYGKSNNNGRGYAACYIASNTALINDEGLYAYSCMADKSRVVKKMNVRDFGKGKLGDATNPTAALNNYASVTAVNGAGNVISYTNKTANGRAPIGVGALVMVHLSKQKDDTKVDSLGRFKLARVLSDDGTYLGLDCSVSDLGTLADYTCQVISVAEFKNLTVSTDYTATPAWDNTKGIGGILAIACTGMLDISGGKLNVEKKGGGKSTFSNMTGNYQDNDRLPLHDGHGSVFLLAKQMNMNADSRIGATYSGAGFGGGDGKPGGASYGGGGYSYPGHYGSPGIYKAGGDSRQSGSEYPAWGKLCQNNHAEGGACCMVIADTMKDFFLSAISTGGQGGRYNRDTDWLSYKGGCGGWAFIYCNSVEKKDDTGVLYL